jgi:choline-sulfatase
VALPAGCRRAEAPVEANLAVQDVNVLLITLDTTRADHLTCYSGPSGRAKTPNLDALAARGVVLAHATAQVPLTLPSHASIMTGEYPTVHGLRGMEGFVLGTAHPTLASIAQAHDFATAAFVGSRVLAKHFGLANGFTTYDDDMGQQAQEDNLPGVFAERRAAQVTDRAIAWLQQNGKRKFFLWAHYFDPHAPYDAPDPYKQNYARDPYSGEIAYTDEQVGRLLNRLAGMGLASRTVVAVLGDHGESLGEHGEMTHGVFLYDSTLHVPFILAGPGIPSGKVVNEQVRSVDMMPTLLACLNLPLRTQVRGTNLLPLIQQGRHHLPAHSYSETLYPRIYFGWSELRAIRTDSWKFIVAPHPELYDLQRDPGETNNVISEFQADAERLRKQLAQVAGERDRREKVATNAVDERTRRELESLGYLSGGATQEIQLGTKAPDPKDRVKVLKILSRVEHSLESNDPARTAHLMEQCLRLDSTNPRAHIYLATAYEQMGQYERAVNLLNHAIDLEIETDKIYSRLGIDYLHLRQIGKAVDAMQHANRINPTDLNNLRNLGMAYLQLTRLDDAARAFRAIIAQNDRYAAAYDGLGLVAIQRGDIEAARRGFEKALDVNPNEVKALLDLGILHQQTGNNEQALHYLELFINKAPAGQFTAQLSAVRQVIQELGGDMMRQPAR